MNISQEVNCLFNVKVLDKEKHILFLKWHGIVNAKEVENATKEMNDIYIKDFNQKKFYIIVDTSELKVFNPETKEEIVKQQKWINDKIYSTHVVAESSLTKRQLKQTHVDSGITNEFFFDNFDEALQSVKEKMNEGK